MAGMMDIMEYRSAVGVSEADETRGMAEVDAWALSQDGFEYRTWSRREDGTWVDVIFWRDLAAAQSADAAFGAQMGRSTAVRNMDEGSFRLERLAVGGALMGLVQDAEAGDAAWEPSMDSGRNAAASAAA